MALVIFLAVNVGAPLYFGYAKDGILAVILLVDKI